MSKNLTTRSDDYSKWYNELVVKADLAENSGVRGCMVIKPYGYAIWEKMQAELDRMFKETGHQNAYFPLFVPKSMFEAEEKNAEGFAKECAIVTHYRLKNDPDNPGKLMVDPNAKLEEELIVRPTSEAIIWSTYKGWVQSYRDLPLLINQWANVVRWEMRTRLFLRTAEFLWQEGHTAHATRSEAIEESEKMMHVYAEFAENFMAIPVIKGLKTETERFAGAEETYCIEALMQDGKALQAGTSHFLGQNFAKAFDVKFANAEGKQEHVWGTSWGVSTRLIGTLIMAHSDDDGLVLPPRVATQQIVILPITPKEDSREAVLASCQALAETLRHQTFHGDTLRVHVDTRDLSGGVKKWEWIKKGVPIRIEIGPRDIETRKICVQRRDQPISEKDFADKESFIQRAPEILGEIHQSLLARATAFRNANITFCTRLDVFHGHWATENPGWLYTPWAGTREQEEELSKQHKITIRCLPIAEAKLPDTLRASSGKCILTGEETTTFAIWGRSY